VQLRRWRGRVFDVVDRVGDCYDVIDVGRTSDDDFFILIEFHINLHNDRSGRQGRGRRPGGDRVGATDFLGVLGGDADVRPLNAGGGARR
jgi:hypothetical protein